MCSCQNTNSLPLQNSLPLFLSLMQSTTNNNQLVPLSPPPKTTMLSLLNHHLRRLFSRLRLRRRHSHSPSSHPKIIITKFHNKPTSTTTTTTTNSAAAVFPNSHSTTTKTTPTIRVATFNAALFSMAPAIISHPHPKNDAVQSLPIPKTNSLNSNSNNIKGILKQSPLHPTTPAFDPRTKKQQTFGKSRLRVSINLPDNEISLGKSRRFGLTHDDDRAATARRSDRAVVDVLRELDADVLALQDVKADEAREMKPLSDLAAALGMHYVFAESWAPEYGNAVLSKWPINKSTVQKIFDHSDFRNVLKTTIDVPDVGELNFYCTHLDHLDENWRMKQINTIIQCNDAPHILAGGLNSLDESDYSEERWTDIVKYYEEMGKPIPKAEVMRFLKNKQYTDAKDFAGECESVVMIAKGQSVQGTCKYGTRLDYILGSPGLKYKFVPGSYSVFSSKGTSDHHIVTVDIMKVESIQEIAATKKKHQQTPKKRVVKITNSSSKTKGIWSTDMR